MLQAEIALRNQTEHVAGLRRKLPTGGPLKKDYAFHMLDGNPVKLSDLFLADKDVLAVYSLMYRPDAPSPCPMCCSMLDGLSGQAGHIGQRINLAIVSAARPDQLADLVESRGWGGLAMLSAQGTSYQKDYHAESADGAQLPMMNVFRKTPSGISHFWGSESFFAKLDGQPRHVDALWPLWNLLDLTPDGRGTDWYPDLSYAR